MEFPKIDTLLDRDEGTHKVIPAAWRLPEFLLPQRWLITEKIDGMNVRIILKKVDPMAGYGSGCDDRLPLESTIQYCGRTDAAQLHSDLQAYLAVTFPLDKVVAAFDADTEAILFGEAYGPKIQSGGVYRKNISFRLFDVVVFGGNGRPWWLNWPDVEDIAKKLGIETVPVLGRYVTLDDAFGLLLRPSSLAAAESPDKAPPVQEGIVARTNPLLFMRNGGRVIWKLKVADFASR